MWKRPESSHQSQEHLMISTQQGDEGLCPSTIRKKLAGELPRTSRKSLDQLTPWFQAYDIVGWEAS